ncbi:HAD family hydrolase [Pacificibacter marinus]|uniref:HAD family hydrolase n=1 Tax=Pacificibacter marinus TaxID=658057 RepID=UPI0020903B16|nr:HAD family phosphatase [Pacificibacter marinus]
MTYQWGAPQMPHGWTPQGYLFDMDGLLLDTERVGQQAFVMACADLDIDDSEARRFFLSLIGGSLPGNTAKTKLWLQGRMDVLEFVAAFNGHKTDLMRENVPLRPYVGEVFERLAKAGAKMAVVTSTIGVAARHELEQAGLLKYLVAVVAGDEVTANKPDPAPYLQGAAALGLEPSDCAAFEDSDTGIRAAMAAGCRAVQIPDMRPENTPLPDLGQGVASDLKAALTLVSPIFQTVSA